MVRPNGRRYFAGGGGGSAYGGNGPGGGGRSGGGNGGGGSGGPNALPTSGSGGGGDCKQNSTGRWKRFCCYCHPTADKPLHKPSTDSLGDLGGFFINRKSLV